MSRIQMEPNPIAVAVGHMEKMVEDLIQNVNEPGLFHGAHQRTHARVHRQALGHDASEAAVADIGYEGQVLDTVPVRDVQGQRG